MKRTEERVVPKRRLPGSLTLDSSFPDCASSRVTLAYLDSAFKAKEKFTRSFVTDKKVAKEKEQKREGGESKCRKK